MAIHIPIKPTDVHELEQFLAEADPFVMGTIQTSKPYGLREYLHVATTGANVKALFDRNLTSRVIDLAGGKSVPANNDSSAHQYRIAAACMAFLITAEAIVETNISFYEMAANCVVGEKELADFYQADHIHPQAYLNIALGRTTLISDEVRNIAGALVKSRLAPSVDFTVPLHHWRKHKHVLTKIALLQRRRDTSPVQKMIKLFEWSVSDGFWDAPAMVFATQYFGTPAKGMLKNINHKEQDLCISGIDNAAWDLTYVSYWKKCAEDLSHPLILCTQDKALAVIGRFLVCADNDRAQGEYLSSLFRRFWNDKKSQDLTAHYQLCQEETTKDRQARSEIIRARTANLDSLTGQLEQELRATFA